MKDLVFLTLAVCVVAVRGAKPEETECLDTCNAACEESNNFCSNIFSTETCASAYAACQQICTAGCACLDPCVTGCSQAQLGCAGSDPSFTVAAICYTSQFFCLNTCPTVCEVKFEEMALGQIVNKVKEYYMALREGGGP